MDKHLTRLKVLGILSYLGLVIAIPMIFASFMFFDAPGSDKKITPWIFAIVTWMLPIALIVAPSISKKMLSKGKVKTAYFVVLFPLSFIAAPFILNFIFLFYNLSRF